MPTKTVKISEEARAVLKRATIEPKAVVLNDPAIDRPLYLEVDKFLKALGGKWNRSAGAHQFPNGTAEVSASIDDGQALDVKKTLEQFYTPTAVAVRMCAIAEIGDGIHVLEPSAGRGAIAEVALDLGANVTAVEIDPESARSLWDLHCREGWLRVSGGDFMDWTPDDAATVPGVYYGEIDVALMNPPFSRNQDVAHVRRAFGFVRPGGMLVAVMSPHWTFAEDRISREFRQWVEALGGEVERLPAGTFKSAGTGVDTLILTIRKPGGEK